MRQLRDLREFLRERTPKKISFLSENQALYDPADPCMVCLVFDRIRVYENPNTIYLCGEGGSSMRLNNVISVSMDREVTPIGHVIHVGCCDCLGRRGGKNITLVLHM